MSTTITDADRALARAIRLLSTTNADYNSDKVAQLIADHVASQMQELRDKIERLTMELWSERDLRDHGITELVNCAKRADSAEQQLAQMLDDKERLDWLERTDGEVHSDGGAGDGPSTWYSYRRSGNRNDAQFECLSAPTIRDAIDAARNQPTSTP